MQDTSKRYVRRSSDALIYCGKSLPSSWFVKDGDSWEGFSEDSIDMYLTEGSQMLASLIQEFVRPELSYNSSTARELRFMLEAIIEIKEVFSSEHVPDLQQE